VQLYDYLLRHYIRPEFAAARIVDITPAWVRRWHANLSARPNIGPSTVSKCYRLLRTMFTTAVEDELIARNPCVLKGASVERHDERPVADVDQIAALADGVEPRYRAMLLLATWCSLRFGELAGLARADIDLSAAVVRVSRQLQELQDGQLVFGPPRPMPADARWRSLPTSSPRSRPTLTTMSTRRPTASSSPPRRGRRCAGAISTAASGSRPARRPGSVFSTSMT
jgi:integrase